MQQPIRRRVRGGSEEQVYVPKRDNLEKNNDSVVPQCSRYPKRSSRKDYKEQEVPDEDHFLCKNVYVFVFTLKSWTN